MTFTARVVRSCVVCGKEDPLLQYEESLFRIGRDALEWYQDRFSPGSPTLISAYSGPPLSFKKSLFNLPIFRPRGSRTR
jgi:hypothetical protein